MKRYRIDLHSKVDLADFDPSGKSLFKGDKAEGKQEALELNSRLEELQELMFAEGKRRLLIVLQAMDTAGKDSTIRHVFDGVNPQGVKVARFVKPSSVEMARDYLWRVHQQVPAKGQITIFNRSHYEDVLVVRVRELVPKKVWKKRYDHINDFERMLADEGVTILKFFLHISKDEQRERLQDRLDQPHKNWKFAKGDLEERKLWDEYMEAYAAAMSKTSTEWAPWYIIPANAKWYRNYVISRILVDTLEGFEMRYPPPEKGLEDLVVV